MYRYKYRRELFSVCRSGGMRLRIAHCVHFWRHARILSQHSTCVDGINQSINIGLNFVFPVSREIAEIYKGYNGETVDESTVIFNELEQTQILAKLDKTIEH